MPDTGQDRIQEPELPKPLKKDVGENGEVKSKQEVTAAAIKAVDASKETSQQFLDKIFNQAQLEFLESEVEISKLSLGDDGNIINIPDGKKDREEEVKKWKKRNGIIDVAEYRGAIIVIINSSAQFPEGCPNIRAMSHAGVPSFSAIYRPKTKICFLDIYNTWDFMEDRYQPAWEGHKVRHELRHHMVGMEDEKYQTGSGEKERRMIDWEDMEEHPPEKFRQLSYLNELHSQYFDTLEGEVGGKDSFRKIDVRFYSAVGSGPHCELSSETAEGQEATKDLFYCLQGMILLKRMIEQAEEISLKEDIMTLIQAAGVVLATERTLVDAKEKVVKIWRQIMSNPVTKTKFANFIGTYEPSLSSSDNTPEVTDELRVILGI